jgi:FkbM family methyltransferase
MSLVQRCRKRDTEFNISGLYSIGWFIPKVHNGNWEENTFHILDHYQQDDKIYLDIGAWIGPTVLYSANKFKQVVCFEPDPVALERLRENISANPSLNNITVIPHALSDQNSVSEFGGNGELGNSMSTLLVGLENKEDFYHNYGEEDGFLSYEERKRDIIRVETLTIETALSMHGIDPTQIGLIKMDIEGGEIILIPAMQTFLDTYKPVLYISLHRVFLRETDINEILDILFDIYEYCYFIDDENNKIKINMKTIQKFQAKRRKC